MTSYFRGRFAPGRWLLGLASLLAISTASLAGAHAYTHKILYSFCAKTNCTDGAGPYGGLIADSTGALFGTTEEGGTHNLGTVFKLTPNAKRTKWKLETLYSFCAKTKTYCLDGEYPNGPLVLDTAGNLYGTAYEGGVANGGVVFKLSPVEGQSKWKLTRIHDFVPGGADGYFSASGLTYDGAQSGALYDGISSLYGTTMMGGGAATGTVFSVTPSAGKTQWKEKILHAFTTSDGTLLIGGVIFDGKGNLFGTADTGGSTNRSGTVFELSPNASKTRWSVTVLHNFCEVHCTDGEDPYATLVLDGSGSLLGTTTVGGANDEGVLYKLVPNGANSQLTVLYNFCSQANCADGAEPGNGTGGPLAIDASGNLFGTTRNGGIPPGGEGVAYELSAGTLTVLYTFCIEYNCTDGAYPSSSVIFYGPGNLIGTTNGGGAYAGGTIYELTP